jgi:hypothetical protein
MSDDDFLVKRATYDSKFLAANPDWRDQLKAYHNMSRTLTSNVGTRSLLDLPLDDLAGAIHLAITVKKLKLEYPAPEPSPSRSIAREPPPGGSPRRARRRGVETSGSLPPVNRASASPARERPTGLRGDPRPSEQYSP